MLQELTKEELLFIDGGHNGDSYRAGKAVGEAVAKLGTLAGFVLVFLMPKS